MAETVKEPSEDDVRRMFEVLNADLTNPSRIEIEQINAKIADLIHKRDFVAESFDIKGINEEIADLLVRKAGLLRATKPDADALETTTPEVGE